MQQMHNKVVLQPVKAEELTKNQKCGSLWVMMFVKKKICRNLKGCAFTYGRKQRNGSNKSDVTSPTTATESVLITAKIDATENLDVTVVDATGAFLTADQDKEAIVILEIEMVNAMLDIDAELYARYVINGKNCKKTHVRSPQQGDVRHAKVSVTLLPKTVKIIKKVWICHQPVKYLHVKQLDGGRTTHSGPACRRHKSVTQK